MGFSIAFTISNSISIRSSSSSLRGDNDPVLESLLVVFNRDGCIFSQR